MSVHEQKFHLIHLIVCSFSVYKLLYFAWNEIFVVLVFPSLPFFFFFFEVRANRFDNIRSSVVYSPFAVIETSSHGLGSALYNVHRCAKNHIEPNSLIPSHVDPFSLNECINRVQGNILLRCIYFSRSFILLFFKMKFRHTKKETRKTSSTESQRQKHASAHRHRKRLI